MARQLNAYKKLKAISDQYLLDNIGERAVAGAPRFNSERRTWIVPILCETPRGILPAGRLELDTNLNMLYATPKSDMVSAIEEQLRRLPYLVFAEEGELQAKGIDAITI